jgi:DNA repair ATPase RecN
MSGSPARKLRRAGGGGGQVPNPVKALEGLAQVGDLASKIEKFVEASQRMQELAEGYAGLEEILETLKTAQSAVESVQERLTSMEVQQEAHRKTILRILYYFKQFFTEGSLIPSELDALEAQLTPIKADEPGSQQQ